MNFQGAWIVALALVSAAGAHLGRATSGPGWPVLLGDTSAMFAPPAFGDVTGDGRNEVISAVGTFALGPGLTVEGLYAFLPGGDELLDGDRNPASFGVLAALDFSSAHSRLPVTLADLDRNGAKEILYLGRYSVHAMGGDGTELDGWPLVFPTPVDAFASAPIMVADVDGDGWEDVIFSSGYDPLNGVTRLHVVDRHGDPLPGWPVEIVAAELGIYVYACLVGDIRGDGRPEIVVASHPNPAAFPKQIFAFDYAGELLWSQPFVAHDIVAGDIDRDGRLDVVALERPHVVDGQWVTGLVVLKGDGQVASRMRFDLGPFVDEQWTQTVNGIPDVQVRRQSAAYVGAHANNELLPDILFLGHVDEDRYLDAVFSTRYIDFEVYGDHTFEVHPPTIHAHRGGTYAVDLARGRVLDAFPLRHTYATGRELPPLDTYLSADRLIDLDGDGQQEIVTSEVDYFVPGHSEVTFRFWDHHGRQLRRDLLRTTTPAGGWVLEPIFRRANFGDLYQDGSLEYGVNMRHGELHLVQTTAPVRPEGPNPHGAWPVFRQNDRRTGVQSARR